MRLLDALGSLLAVGLVSSPWIAACGGTSSDPFDDLEPDGGGREASSEDDAGAGGAQGGRGGAQGSGGATGGSAGLSNAGGTSGTGGAGGAGGSGGASSDCAGPARAVDAALCLTFSPEAMDFESDPAFDGSGVLAVQVFDTPNPPSENADAVALYSRLWPADIENDEIEITALPSPRVVVPNAPSTVYVRVFFADNPAIFDEQDLVAGTWVGGFDLGDGLAEGVGLEPVTIEPGQGKELEVPLIAFRRFDVTVNVSATPLGNGQGPLGVAAVRNANAAGEPPIFGLVEAGCVDAADAPFSTTGALIGSGDFFVTGILYDFGDTEDLAPGSLSSLDVDFEQNTATIPTRISVGARDYSASATIDLDFVAPMVADGGAPADTTCSGDAPDGGS